ncbi:hypothetical protein C9374_013638 [Naegleria lovaniensis]|uniref:Uncharacterized protein n=1 Tax=Naegleria lovaniensis TaxID=51637 RepID=A0AA88GBU7_NAELO|nr:uncharacterized protein C9374_013638 [Naegleria lovaniensis]KAG2372683.1 hypothetical protein C9374_013638 [Naegleria lovaniensis]
MEAGTRWLSRGFSTNFDWVHSIGTTVESSQNDFQNNFETHAYLEFPYDVKISYNHQCILITDFLTHQLLVCDLMNYSPKAYIDAPSDFPTRMYIEKNYEKQRDALYLMCRNGSIVMLMKYDLELFLKAKSLRDDEERNSIHSSGFIWKTTNCSMQAFVVNTALKRVMGCDFGESCLKILNSENGEFLHKIQFTNVPFAIDLAKDDIVII